MKCIYGIFIKTGPRQPKIFIICTSRDAVNVRIIQFWFSKFKSGNFSLTDKHDDNMLMAIINANLRQNTVS